MPRHHFWQAIVSPSSVLMVALGVGVYLVARDPSPAESRGEAGVIHAGGAGPIYALAYAPNGTSLASGAFQDRVRVWAPATGKSRGEFMDQVCRTSALAYSPDSKTLAIAGISSSLNAWDVAIRGVETGGVDAVLHGHTDKVVDLAFAPDGQTLASASLDGSVRLWDTTDYHLRMVIRGSRPFHCLVFEPSGRTLLAGGSDGAVRRWDATTGRDLGILVDHRATVHRLAIAPDGKTVATWEIGELAVRLWDTATGALRARACGHTGYVQALAFAPDGATFASGSLDGTVRLWDTATGRERTTLRTSDSSGIHALAFAPDGTVLASGGGRSTLTLWDVPRSLAGVATVMPIGLADR